MHSKHKRIQVYIADQLKPRNMNTIRLQDTTYQAYELHSRRDEWLEIGF